MKVVSFMILLCISVYSSAQLKVFLTANYQKSSGIILLKWQNTLNGIRSFTLQRSSDHTRWEDIYSVSSTQFNVKRLEKFADRPQSTQIFYRLRIDSGGVVLYSAAVFVDISQTFDSWKMYPIPVTDWLLLQYEGGEILNGVVSVYIQNISGYTLVRKRFSSIGRIFRIPVNNLGRGVYVITVLINSKKVWSRKFVK